MGILMERYGLGSDQAFEVLKRYSQETGTKLQDAARAVIDGRAIR